MKRRPSPAADWFTGTVFLDEIGMTEPARYSAEMLEAPRARASDVQTTLADFAIVTYAVEPQALTAFLPPELEPEIRTLDDGRRVAFVSAVPFRDLDFRFGFAPFLKFSFGQTNYRAYVRSRADGKRSVWFFGTALATHWVRIPQLLWRLPWHRAAIHIDASYAGEVCTQYALEASGQWGGASLLAAGTDAPTGRLDGFADEEDTAAVLTHPLDGYFYLRGKQGAAPKPGSYSVWHDRMKLYRASCTHARFDVFERLGLVAPDAAPHSVLIQRTIEFLVRLPPRPAALG